MAVLLVLAAVVAVLAVGPAARDSLFGVSTESRDSQIVTAIERQEQIVLLSTSVQGLKDEQVYSELFGRTLPGTGRTKFLQYSYRAKLGIEGGEVAIEETGEDTFLVTVPEFIFIGHDRADFKTATEENGALSWVTPEIDTAAMITEILSEGEMTEQIESNQDLLQDQARAIYTGIIQAIDEDIDVDFEFSDD
ncbi:hypothetical protein [Nesterenkonia sp. CF4.4]|uniref:hypothetical protein n=1 Tax=Nesterenkonia sp. CF4.4 TaxID=3373079 RepID=UPI003EE79C5A